MRLESTGFLERDPLRDGGFFKNRPQNALARKPELRSSPERIRLLLHHKRIHYRGGACTARRMPKGALRSILRGFSCADTTARGARQETDPAHSRVRWE